MPLSDRIVASPHATRPPAGRAAMALPYANDNTAQMAIQPNTPPGVNRWKFDVEANFMITIPCPLLRTLHIARTRAPDRTETLMV
jgi:hypothetical protein